MIIKDFIEQFEKFFPKELAYSWDNIGLQIGSDQRKITNILLSLDLTLEVVEEAISNKCNFIVVHHPVIFSAVKSIISDNYQGLLIENIIKNDITIYVAHTNFDISNYGMNKILADMLGLQNQGIIEMVTDIEGLGRFGTLKEPMVLSEYIKEVKKVFDIDSVKLVGDLSKLIKTVGIAGGSGGSLLNHPRLEVLDLYITGDISYHHALDALNKGVSVLDVGHNIEKHSLSELQKLISEFSKSFDILISKVNTDPYIFR